MTLASLTGTLFLQLTLYSKLQTTMKLIRYTDLHDWESLFGDPFRAFAPLLRAAGHSTGRTSPSRAPSVDVEWFEDDANYYARVDLPGMKREHLHLDVEDGLVRLRHERKESDGGKITSASRHEQILRCPDGIRPDAIAARLSDGVLQLTLPKEEARKPVSITID